MNKLFFFFFQAEDGIRDATVTGVQTCALPILRTAGPDVGEPVSQRRPPGAGRHLDEGEGAEGQLHQGADRRGAVELPLASAPRRSEGSNRRPRGGGAAVPGGRGSGEGGRAVVRTARRSALSGRAAGPYGARCPPTLGGPRWRRSRSRG